MSIKSVMPSNHLILCHPLLLLPSIFPSIRVFSNEISSLHQVAKGLEFQLQHQSFWWIFRTDSDGLVGSPCCPRDSQECSPTPRFKSIYSLALSFLLVQLSPVGLVIPWTVAASVLCGSTEVGCRSLLQGIFPTQVLNLHLLLGRWILYHWTTR